MSACAYYWQSLSRRFLEFVPVMFTTHSNPRPSHAPQAAAPLTVQMATARFERDIKKMFGLLLRLEVDSRRMERIRAIIQVRGAVLMCSAFTDLA